MSSDNDKSGPRGANRRKFLAATAGVASFALSGCSGDGGDGGDGGGSTDGDGLSGDPIRIGAPYLLSGVGEAIGNDSLNGAEIAVEQINNNGGVNGRPIEVIPRDHAGDDAARVLRSLVTEDEVHGMIGLTSSGVAIATAPLIGELGVPQILCDIGSPYVTEHNVEEYGEEQAVGNDFRFRANAGTVQGVWSIAKRLRDDDLLSDVETLGYIGPDYAFGHQEWAYLQAYADAMELGLEYTEPTFIGLGESDMTAQITQAISSEPDMIVTSQWSDDQVTFTRQAIDQDINDVVDHVCIGLGSDITQLYALGEDQPEGWLFHGWHWPGTPDIEAQHEWVQTYQDMFDREPGGFSVSATEGVLHFAEVIEEVGDDPADIAAELPGHTLDGPRGEHTFHPESHHANAGVPYGTAGEFNPDLGLGRVEMEDLTYLEPEREQIHSLLEGSGLPPGW